MEEHEHDDRRRTVLKALGGSAAVGAFAGPTAASEGEDAPAHTPEDHEPIGYDIKVKNNGVTGDDVRVEVAPSGDTPEYVREFELPALKERPDDEPKRSVAEDDLNLRGGGEYVVRVETPDGTTTETFDVPRGGVDPYSAVLVSRYPNGSVDVSLVLV